jgi:hypothetical protein
MRWYWQRASEWVYWSLCASGLHKWRRIYPDDTFHTCMNCARMSDQ